MRNIGRISATKTLLQKAAWIDASEYGVASSIVMPRVRDNLGLRLVAGRRRERDRNLIHATGAP